MSEHTRFTVEKNEPGLLIGKLEIMHDYVHKDGDLYLRVEWSADDACYVARYEGTTKCIGVGDTIQDALAHLCGALLSEAEAWRALYESTNSAEGETI
jgi:predicted RNase H-like HicB family nuclease